MTSGPLGRSVMSGPLARSMTSGPLSQPLRGPLSQPQPGTLSQPNRLQLSALIEDRIRGKRVREGQRAWLVTTVTLAQALITLMIVPGYLFPTPNLPVLLTLGVALLFYLTAFIFNRVRHELRVAVYMLVGGGALATAALVFVTALLTDNATHTAQATLLFLPLVLEAGLFLTPELTLYVASASAVVTASAILLALALGADSTSQLSEAYLVMVYSLGLDTFIGYLAWRLAQFIYETVKNAQADDDLRFAQARLSAAERQMSEQHRQLTQDVAAIQLAVSSALAHEYESHIEISDGDLAPLADSLNLLVKQLRSTNELERRLQDVDAQAVRMAEMAGRLATGDAPAPGMEGSTDTALFAVRAALSQAHALSAQRQARLQEIAAEMTSLIGGVRGELADSGAASAQAQQIAGQLVALVAALNQTATRQNDLVAQARRGLALVLPPELTQDARADSSLLEPPARDLEATGDLIGLGQDLGIMNRYTSEFDVLTPLDQDAAGIPPMTPPPMTPPPTLQALGSPSNASAESMSEPAAEPGALPASLADVWLALGLLQQQTTEETRAVAGFVHDIGVLSRQVRLTSAGIDRAVAGIDSIEVGAEQVQQVTSPSSGTGELVGGDLAAFARPAPPSAPRRAPQVTHPLDPESQLARELDAQAPAQEYTPDVAPGSLRVADLLGPEAFGGASGPSTPGASAAGSSPAWQSGAAPVSEDEPWRDA